MRATLVALALAATALPAFAAPVMNEPGWTIAPFAKLPGAYVPDIPGVDASGNLYVSCGTNGIYRFTPDGVQSLWSTAASRGIAVLPDGEVYAPSRAIFPTRYIWHITPDGTATPLVSTTTISWLFAEVTDDGTLYANTNSGAEGVYQIDTSTGARTVIVNGKAEPGSTGGYWDMASTSDGTVYLSAQLSASDNAIFRLDVAQDTCMRVLTVPYPQIGLCRGPSDTLYGATYQPVGMSSQGQVYKLDIAGNAVTVFASGFGQSVGIIYDPSHFRFYVVEQGGQIWKITSNTTSTKTTSWGGLKSLYR